MPQEIYPNEYPYSKPLHYIFYFIEPFARVLFNHLITLFWPKGSFCIFLYRDFLLYYLICNFPGVLYFIRANECRLVAAQSFIEKCFICLGCIGAKCALVAKGHFHGLYFHLLTRDFAI